MIYMFGQLVTVLFCLTENEEVVSVIESQPDKYSLQTTRSWEFSGVEETKEWNSVKNSKRDKLLFKSKYGKDIIIGVLDTGIYLNSFSDYFIKNSIIEYSNMTQQFII